MSAPNTYLIQPNVGPKTLYVQLAQVARDARVFYDPGTKELLIFSKNTWQDLPVQPLALHYEKPHGWRYLWHCWWYGESIARFFWRNRKGYSSISVNVKAKLRERP